MLVASHPFPLAHIQGFRHIMDDRSGVSHAHVMARLELAFWPVFSASGSMFPASFSNRRTLPASSKGSAQRQVQKHLTPSSFTCPSRWSHTISEGSLKRLLSIQVQIPQSKANWLSKVDGTIQGQTSLEDTATAGTTYIDRG